MDRLTSLAAGLLALQAAAPSPAPPGDADAGAAIYEEGAGRDALTATIGHAAAPIDARARACAACHGAAGTGGSEGGVAAPALALDRRDHAALHAFTAALTTGRGRDGRTLDRAMPRYAISERDLADLAAYVATLPFPVQAGLSGTQVAIALDLGGAALDARQHAALVEHWTASIARANRAGGVFGRRLAAAGDGARFITVAWSARGGRPELSILPPLATLPASAPSCGALHATIEEQAEWLGAWLRRGGRNVRYGGSAAAEFASVPGVGRVVATIHVGEQDEATRYPKGPLYLLADLGPLPAALVARPDTYLVASFDLAERAAAVQALMQNAPALDSPRLAGAALALDEALGLIVATLESVGRRAMRRDVCRGLHERLARSRRYSIYDLTEQRIVELAR